MPIPDAPTRQELSSISNEMSSSSTQTPRNWLEDIRQLRRELTENSIPSLIPPRLDNEPSCNEEELLSQIQQRPSRQPEHWDPLVQRAYEMWTEQDRTGSLSDRIDTTEDLAIASPTIPQISSKARSTFKEFSQRIESTASSTPSENQS